MSESLDPAGHPVLEQRFAPWVTVRTTAHAEGLLIQVRRPFAERVTAIAYERLLLEPASVAGLVRARLALAAAALLAAPTAAALPIAGWVAAPLGPWLAICLPPALLALAVLVLLAALGAPRHVSLLLDRELLLHPAFRRDGPDEPAVAAFLDEVRRLSIARLCARPEEDEADEDDEDSTGLSLAGTLDALSAMHAEGLLDAPQFARFRELAIGR